MRKDFGVKTWMFPMPVLIIGTYNSDGTPNAMNAAWGGVHNDNQVHICLATDHLTTDNIKERKAFTVTFGSTSHLAEADYLGIVSGNKVKDKIAKAGLTVTPSTKVDAPIINEFPVCLECNVESIVDDGKGTTFLVGNIVNVSADESVIDEDGKVNPVKMEILCYESTHHYYLEASKVVGHAFKDGMKVGK